MLRTLYAKLSFVLVLLLLVVGMIYAFISLSSVRYYQHAYSRPNLPLIPEQACHPFQTKAATDSRAKLPPWQIV